MELNPPPGLPSPPPDPPARPTVIPIRPALVIPALRRPAGRQAPLPDPVAVRRVQVPDSLPPYDGPPPGEPPDTRPRNDREPGDEGPDDGRPNPGRPGEPAQARHSGRAIPGPDGWPSQFAQVLAETLAGARPARQLAPWTTEQTRERIRELGPLLASSRRPRLRRVMTSAPAADVLEVTAVVGFGGRVRVLALRLERADAAADRWQCTALESA
jgi:hypothetical protein